MLCYFKTDTAKILYRFHNISNCRSSTIVVIHYGVCALWFVVGLEQLSLLINWGPSGALTTEGHLTRLCFASFVSFVSLLCSKLAERCLHRPEIYL